jgi:hypothetical protein
MKILFLTLDNEDYLGESIFHGLRNIYGTNVVDFPKNRYMYNNCEIPNKEIYGNGFSLYKTLVDLEIDRNDIDKKIISNYFNLIIFSDFSKQFEFYFKYRKYLNNKNTVILDGNDYPKLYPFHGRFWKLFPLIFFDISYFKFLTFKREWTTKTLKYRYFIPFSNILGFMLYRKISLRKISFSIPDVKIYKGEAIKHKLFPRHIVDSTLLEKLNHSSFKYVFENEKDYYSDLQISKYGITTKRAGWDCMRHYEIAANGSVICFKKLKLKPEMCAPHDLVPGYNCLNYETYEDLMNQINSLTDLEYEQLRSRSLEWIKSKTTESVAKKFINDFLNFSIG